MCRLAANLTDEYGVFLLIPHQRISGIISHQIGRNVRHSPSARTRRSHEPDPRWHTALIHGPLTVDGVDRLPGTCRVQSLWKRRKTFKGRSPRSPELGPGGIAVSGRAARAPS